MEIVLDFNAIEGQFHAVISYPENVSDTRVPLQVTHFTPCAQFPVLVADSSGRIPEAILDHLMLEFTRKENVQWHEYFKARRSDQRCRPQEIAQADRMFKAEAIKGVARYEAQCNG